MKCLLLLTIILISICHYIHAQPKYYSKPITIGVVWDRNDWINIRSTIDLAIDDFRALFPVNVSVVYEDATQYSTGTVAAGMRMAKRSPIAVIGTCDSLSTLPLVNLGGTSKALNVPILHTVSGSATLEIGALIRTSNAFSGYGDVIYELLTKQNWTRVALIHSLDVEGRVTTDHMIQFPVPNSEYSIFTLGGNDDLMRYTLQSTLDNIESSGLRVIVVHGIYTLEVLLAAGRRGMMQAPYSWIGTDWCRDSTILDQLDNNWLMGVTCVDSYGYETLEWTIFQQRVIEKARQKYPGEAGPMIRFSNTFLYDAIGTIAYAVDAQQREAVAKNSTTGITTLIKSLAAVSFQGAVAPMHFAKGAINRVVYASILNYNPQSRGFEQVGTYNESMGDNSTMQLHRNIIYSNGNQYGQSDRDDSFRDMEVLITHRDARMSILSYVMSVLGFWTMLLLLEQAITRKKKQMIRRAAATVHRRSRWQKIRAYRWILWVILAAVVAGISGIVQCIIVDLFGVSVDNTLLKIDIGSIVGYMFASAGIMLVGLLAPFMFLQPSSSWSYSPSTQVKSSTGSRDKGSVLTSIAPSTKHASVSKQPTDSTNSQSNKESEAYRCKMTFYQLFSWRLAVCCAMYTVSTVLSHYRLFVLIEGPFVEQGDTKWFAYSALFLLFVGWVPWWMVYHYHRSSMRFMVSFLLAAVTFGANQLMFKSHKWVYSGDVVYDSDAFAWSEMSALVVSAACVALCLFSLAANVLSLKVSQRVLGLHLAEIRERVERVSRQVKEQEETFARLQDAVEMHAKLILLTTYCRPCMRSYAEIWAVCCDDEQLALQCLRGNRLPSLLMPSAGWNDGPTAKKVKINLNINEQESRLSFVKPLTPVHKPNQSASVAPTNGTASPQPSPSTLSPVGPGMTQNFVLSSSPIQRATAKSPANQVNTLNRDANLRLADILAHPFGCELLRDQLEKKHTPENLMFYCDVARYKKLDRDWTTRRAATEIFNLYIKEGAPYQINIQHQLRAQLLASSAAYQLEDRSDQQCSSQSLPLDMFDAADMEIWNLIQTNEIYTLNKQCTPNQVRIIQEMVL